MGRSFANITVRGQTQDILVNYLSQHERNAYVSPSVHNLAVVYDEDSEFNIKGPAGAFEQKPTVMNSSIAESFYS